MAKIRTFTIEVTQEDIDNGCQNNSLACPLAKAFLRATQHSIAVYTCTISYAHEEFNGDLKYRVTKLPENARQFIQDFDNGIEVVPFSFTIDLYI